MSKNLLDPRDYKHVKSDENSTTLQHKRGHIVTIAHNAVSPKNREMLKSLADRPSDNSPQYGQVVKKFADGTPDQPVSPAPAPQDTTTKEQKARDLSTGAQQSGGVHSDSPLSTGDWSHIWKAEGGEVKMAIGGHVENNAPGSTASGAYDAGLPCLNPHCKSHGKPHPNCRCYANMADGGEVSKVRYCAHGKPHMDNCEYSKGISEQGKDIRHGNRNPDQKEMSQDFAKEEAKGRASDERQIKPKMKGLAEGGRVMYAEAGEVEPLPIPGGGVQPRPADHYKEAARLLEKAGDSMEGRAPQAQANAAPPNQQMQANPDDDANANTLAVEDPIDHGNDHYGHPEMQGQPQNQQSPQAQQQAPQAQQQAPQVTQGPPPTDSEMASKALYDHLNDQATKAAMDYGNGHITPKTYNDLMFYNYDKDTGKKTEKSTLGQIGAIFGLMIGGAGSALAHQPNAALQMMDKAIDNDLEAQKASKSGQQNFLNLAKEYYKSRAEVGLTQSQKRAADINNEILGTNLAKQQMMLGVVNHLYGLSSKLPPEQRPAATQAADAVASAAQQKIQQGNAQTAQAVVARSAPLIGSQQEYTDKTQQLRGAALLGMPEAGQAADIREQHMIPGVGTTLKPVTGDDSKRVLQINNFQNLLKEAKDLASAQKLGPLSPAQKTRAEAIESDLVSSYNDVKGLTRFTSNEEALYKNVVPNLASNLSALSGSRKASLDRLIDSVQQKKDLEYSQLGIKPFAQEPKQQKQLTPAEQSYLNWAQKNPNDPRSAAVLKKLGR